MISDALAVYNLLREIHGKAKILAALFDPDGSRLEGDDQISVEVHRESDDSDVWWYEIKPLDDYEFIRIPVNVSAVVESLGQIEGKPGRDADYFRYVPVPDGRIRGKLPSVRINFMVFGYRPKDLLSLARGAIG